jgi:hypothetical protein
MRVIRSERNSEFQEIEVETNYIFWKIRTIYRNYDGSIFKYKFPNNFYLLGTFERYDIREFFRIKL